MNKKAFIVAVFVLYTVTGALVAQDALSQLSKDLQTVLDELGKEMGPNLQTVSVLNHGLGSAEIGSFPRMYFSLSAGASVAPGILGFLDDEEKYDNYALLENFLEEASLEEGSNTRDITDSYAPYPSGRASFGVGLVGGWEIDVQAGIIPQAAAELVPVDGLTTAITTVGGRVRKVVVRQERGVPAVSLGLGYVYSGINFGFDLEEIDPLDTGGTTLDLDGELTYQATTHSFGTDVRVSTRVLRVFYPFIGASGYYQRTTYKAGIDNFSALVGSGTTPTVPTTEPLSEQEFNSFNVVLNSGFDIKLAVLNIFTHVNYAFSTQAPGVIVGVRVQI